MADPKATIIITARDQTQAAFASASKGLDGVAGKAQGLAGSVAGLPAIGPMIAAAFSVAAFKGVIDSLDSLDDLAEKTGISASRLSELRYASEVAGTSFEDLQAGAKKLVQGMADAAGGSKEAQAKFAALGVAVTDASGKLRGTDEVLQDIAAKFASYADGPAKAALAQDVFGKSGQQLIPVLNKGRDGLAAMSDEARKLGAVIDNDTAAAAASLNDDLMRLSLATQGAAAALAGPLVKGLATIVDQFVAARKEAGLLESVLITIGMITARSLKLDETGALQAQADGLSANIGRVTDSVERMSEALARDPADKLLAGRLEKARSRLTDLQRQAAATSEALKAAADATNPAAAATGTKPDAPNVAKPDGAAAAAASQAQQAYDSLIAKIRSRVEESDRELSAIGKVSEADKFAAKIIEELASSRSKLTAAQRASAQAMLESAVAQLRDNEAMTAGKVAREEMARLQGQMTLDLLKESDTIAAQNRALSDQAEEAGLTAVALGHLAVARQDVATAAADQALADALADGATPERIAALQLVADEMRRQLQLRRQMVAMDQAREGAGRADLMLQEAEATSQQTAALREAIQEIGLNARALEALRMARLQDAAAAQQQALSSAIASGASMDEINAMSLQLETLQEYIKTRREVVAANDAFGADSAAGMKRGIDEYITSLGTANDRAAELAASTAQSFEAGLTGLLQGQQGAAKQMIDSIISEFLRLAVIKPLMASIFGGGGSGGSSANWGSLIGLLGGLFGGGATASASATSTDFSLATSGVRFGGMRAGGGPVAGGSTYLVGEQGPEFFTPRGAGNITPNHALGGAVTVVINNSVGEFVTPSQLARVATATRQSAMAGMADARVRGRAA